MTPEDLHEMIAKGIIEKERGFLKRRNAEILGGKRALIRYGNLTLLIAQGCAYDHYVVQSFYPLLGSFKHVLLNLSIPKIPDKYKSGFFDIFGEEIPNEKNRRSETSQ